MRIYSPNTEYCGISASVDFVNGEGETNDPDLIGWFKEHGYAVETEDEIDIETMSVKELKAYAEANGVDLGNAKTKAEIIACIKTDEAGVTDSEDPDDDEEYEDSGSDDDDDEDGEEAE